MSLTIHQQEKHDDAVFILQNSNRLLIRGSAGVGKTFLADSLVKSLLKNLPHHKSVLCTTPTHKALAVLRGKVTPHRQVVFSTVHSALKLKRHINKTTGEVSFKPNHHPAYPPLKGIGILLVDEASMLNTQLLEILEEYATQFRVKVIFLGDEKQLNPVGEENSPVFHADYPSIELTEIVRQGEGNPIIELSRKPSMMVQYGELVTEDNKGFTFTHDRNRIVNSLAQVNGTDDLKYLAWTNAEVDSINKAVRERIYGVNPKKVEVGEILVFNTPYGEEYYTNYELLVEEVKIIDIKRQIFVARIMSEDKYVSINFRCYIVNPESDNPVRVIHEDSEKHLVDLLKLMKGNCIKRFLKWVDYYSFAESFADLKYNHAITVHKSQGSTYQKAIVNVKNINFNKNHIERKRLLYTAITRASDLLILYNVN